MHPLRMLQDSPRPLARRQGWREAEEAGFRIQDLELADAVLRNACLMLSNPLTNSADVGMMVETAVYKHFLNAYGATAKVGYLRTGSRQKEVDIAVDFFPRPGRLLCEVKYRNHADLAADDALLSLCRESSATAALVATKSPADFGITRRADSTGIPLVRIPAHALCYLMGERYRI